MSKQLVVNFVERLVAARKLRPSERSATITMIDALNQQGAAQFSEFDRSPAAQQFMDLLSSRPELPFEDTGDAQIRAKAKELGFDLNDPNQFEEGYGRAAEACGMLG
jgi:hypothetical protein